MIVKRYEVTLHRCNLTPESVTLLVHRTANEVNALCAKGYNVTAVEVETPFAREEPPSNERRPNVYSRALQAVADLARHAEARGQTELSNRASEALGALLKGQAQLNAPRSHLSVVK
jgi:hypothetical protein